MSSGLRWAGRMAALLVLAALAAFYYYGATAHARQVNPQRGRADQSGYLWDAVAIHGARHGGPDGLIGERNRMPAYPWLLSWFYDPAFTPDEFFEVAKLWNVRLSLVLLAILGLIARRYLPLLPSLSFILVIAFGYFIFKAGYAQVELLYYALFFVTVLASWRLLESRSPKQTIAWAVVTGITAAVTHLAKAAVLPLIACLAVPFAVRALVDVRQAMRAGHSWPRTLAWRVAAAGLFTVCFLGVLSPYLLNSKRVFGQYFYNVNTTFYVWYDNWNLAANGTYRAGDGIGWPQMPASDIPTMRTYVRTRPPQVIAARLGNGLREMVVVSYDRLWYFKYVTMYLLFASAVVVSRRRDVAQIARRHWPSVMFFVLYAGVYTLATAFYQPISGTTLRMLLTHVAPLLFVLSCLVWRTPLRETTWRVAGARVQPMHFCVLMVATVCFDVSFRLWPWLMTDFAGY